MGWQVNPDVIANTVIVTGPAGVVVGIFVYQIGTTPGPGNPPVEWMSQFLADPYGNILPTAGIASEAPGGGEWATFSNGILAMGFNSSQPTAQAFTASMPNAGEVVLTGPTESPTDTSGLLSFISKTASDGAGALLNLATAAFTSKAGTASNPSVLSSDVWNTASNNAGATGTLQYSYEPNGPNGKGCVRLRGECITNANEAANFVMFSIPYAPAQNHSFVTPTNASGYSAGNRVVTVTTAGAVEFAVSSTSGNFVILDGIVVPLA